MVTSEILIYLYFLPNNVVIARHYYPPKGTFTLEWTVKVAKKSPQNLRFISRRHDEAIFKF